jgi:hypothetical protein
MQPLPAPQVPGNTEYERFDAIVRKVMAFKPAAIAEQPKRKQPKKHVKKSH